MPARFVRGPTNQFVVEALELVADGRFCGQLLRASEVYRGWDISRQSRVNREAIFHPTGDQCTVATEIAEDCRWSSADGMRREDLYAVGMIALGHG